MIRGADVSGDPVLGELGVDILSWVQRGFKFKFQVHAAAVTQWEERVPTVTSATARAKLVTWRHGATRGPSFRPGLLPSFAVLYHATTMRRRQGSISQDSRQWRRVPDIETDYVNEA